MNDSSKTDQSLTLDCRRYLSDGPPRSMSAYVPGSLTEIIIEHGAQGIELDAELREIAGLIIEDAADFAGAESPEVRTYLLRGAALVRAVVASQSAATPSP